MPIAGFSSGYMTAPVNVSPFLESLTKPLIVAVFRDSPSEKHHPGMRVKKTNINIQILVVIQFYPGVILVVKKRKGDYNCFSVN
jgi:hypothetical protein